MSLLSLSPLPEDELFVLQFALGKGGQTFTWELMNRTLLFVPRASFPRALFPGHVLMSEALNSASYCNLASVWGGGRSRSGSQKNVIMDHKCLWDTVTLCHPEAFSWSLSVEFRTFSGITEGRRATCRKFYIWWLSGCDLGKRQHI